MFQLERQDWFYLSVLIYGLSISEHICMWIWMCIIYQIRLIERLDTVSPANKKIASNEDKCVNINEERGVGYFGQVASVCQAELISLA